MSAAPLPDGSPIAVKRYRYTHLVGGPADRSRAPEVPDDQSRIMFARMPAPYWGDSTAPAPLDASFTTDTYVQHKVHFGSSIGMSFFAHESLSGEVASERLFLQMMRRLSIKEDR